MILLDFISLLSLAWLFTLVTFSMAVDPDKTLTQQPDGSVMPVEMTPDQKRNRLMWFLLASILPMLTALLHIVLFYARIP